MKNWIWQDKLEKYNLQEDEKRKYIQMAGKHLERCSTPLVIRKKQIRPQ